MVGCETADLLGEHGHEVTIVDMLPEIATDVQDSVRYFLLKRLMERKIAIYTNTKVTEFIADGAKAEKDGKDMLFTGFDTIIIAVGAKPVNNLRYELEGKVPELYIIGDALEARKAIDAIEEGASVAIKL